MNIPNCPRCNMYLAPGAQTCPNCHLDLRQFPVAAGAHYQAAIPPAGTGPGGVTESTKEKVYRKLLILLAILVMGEFVLYRIVNALGDWIGFGAYPITRLFDWLIMLAWTGIPLVIALVLPKNRPGRIVLIVFASIYVFWKLSYFVYHQFFYDPWIDNPYPPTF